MRRTVPKAIVSRKPQLALTAGMILGRIETGVMGKTKRKFAEGRDENYEKKK